MKEEAEAEVVMEAAMVTLQWIFWLRKCQGYTATTEILDGTMKISTNHCSQNLMTLTILDSGDFRVH